MGGIIDSLNTGMNALLHNQLGMNVVSNNIANTSNPAYSRQRVDAGPSPTGMQSGIAGSGVVSLGITSTRDAMLDSRVRDDRSMLGYWSSMSSSLSGVEGALNEDGENGLSSILSEFWNSWGDLAANPDDLATRSSLISSAGKLSSTINALAESLESERIGALSNLSDAVSDLNDTAASIANLNEKIVEAEKGGAAASELRDQRGALIDHMADLVDVSVIEEENGAVSISISGFNIVEKRDYVPLSVSEGNIDQGNTILLEAGGTEVFAENGSIGALLELTTSVIPGFSDRLNSLAGTIISRVNSIHENGYGLDGKTTGIEFFTGDDAATMSVSPVIADNPSLLAASATGASNDNGTALAIKNLGEADNVIGSSSINGYYDDLVMDIGLALQEAKDGVDRGEGFVAQSEGQRTSLRGVNLDEEMVDMIKYQNAYNAAATVISTVDEMVQSIIAMTG